MFCVKKISCHKWDITETTGQVVYTGDVKSLDGTVVVSLDNPSDTVTFTSDGIYIVTITTNQNVTSKFVIFDFCDLFACVKKLLLEIWCKEDICCDRCDEKVDSKKRHELNKMMAVFQSLIAVTYASAFTFFGLTCLSDANMKKIGEVKMLYDTLKKLVENCGECKDVKANTLPCKTC